MHPFNQRLFLAAVPLLLFFTVQAQRPTLYNYQDLSKTFYKSQKDSIENAWKCPSAFDDRPTQKKYRELWDDRTKYLTSSFENNDYVYEKEVITYVYGIIDELMKANPAHFKGRPFLLLDRSASVNAYAVGNNVIAVNLGLINFCQSREELALVIAHELSHNILQHAENSMKSRAEVLASNEYKDSLNAVLKSKYERLSRLKKVLQTYTFDRRRHQRYHEGDADSLAIGMLKKARLNFDARYFLRLDSADNTYMEPLQQDIGKYFAHYNITIDDAWTKKRSSRGLSSRNFNIKDSSANRDSLKTHPDCEERYKKNLAKTDAGKSFTPIPATIREQCNKMLLWNLYNNGAYTACMYRILQEKDRGNKDEWYDFMFNNAIASIYQADRDLRRFNAIGVVQKENVSAHYFQLQTLLEQIPRENLETVCRQFQSAPFWSKLKADEKSFKSMLSSIALDQEVSPKARAGAASSFSKDHPNSAYREFASPFEKYK